MFSSSRWTVVQYVIIIKKNKINDYANTNTTWDDECTEWMKLSVDLLRYIGEMLFELFSILCSVIYIIKILFITHTCTTAYNIHIYVFYVQHNVEYANPFLHM